MNIQNVNCSKCSKNTTALWAANPADKNLVLCPECFSPIRKKQGGINFPYSLFIGQPANKNGLWCDQPSTNFAGIAHFIEVCVGKIRGNDAEIPTNDHATLDEMLIRLYDFVTDPTEVPYWRIKIQTAEKIARGMPSRAKQHSLELGADIQFWRSRIEHALMPGSSVAAAKQNLMLQHLKACIAAWKLGEPLPKTPPIIIEVNWELLEPDGTGTWEQIKKYYDNLDQSSNCERDDGRLKLIQDKEPDLIFVGRSKFDGYVVFVFSRADVAFLESAYVGNALYVMKASEWKDLSKLSKTELLSNPRNDVQRVIHTNHWRIRLHRLFCKYGMN
jgi:hypothetical protein